MLRRLVPLLLVLNFAACTVWSLKKKFHGVWIVEEFIVNGENRLWEEFEVNAFCFYEENICELPIRDLSLDDKAKWEITKTNQGYVLEITEASDSIFNRQYGISLDTRKQGDAIVKVLKLSSEGLVIKCSQ